MIAYSPLSSDVLAAFEVEEVQPLPQKNEFLNIPLRNPVVGIELCNCHNLAFPFLLEYLKRRCIDIARNLDDLVGEQRVYRQLDVDELVRVTAVETLGSGMIKMLGSHSERD